MSSAIIIYHLSLIMVIVQILQVPYISCIIAYEDMSIYAYIGIFEVLVKLIIAYIISIYEYDRLILFVFLSLFSNILVLFIYWIVSKYKYTICRYKFCWNTLMYKQMLSFSGWSSLGQLAYVSSNQGVNVLLNIFFKVSINAAVGIANQVNGALNSFVQNFQTAFKPRIVKLYASGNYADVRQLIYSLSKFSFYLLFVLALPIILNIDFVLQVWLNEVPDFSASFCVLIVVASLIEAIAGPLWMSVFASGNIKNYQMIISLILLSNIIFSYILLIIGLPPISVMYVKIFTSIVTLIIRMIFAKKIVGISLLFYLTNTIIPIFFVIIISVPLLYFLSFYVANFMGLLLYVIASVIYIILVVFLCGMSQTEKYWVLEYVRCFMNKKRNVKNYHTK